MAACPCWTPGDGGQCSTCGEVQTPERYTIPDIARELDVRPNTVTAYHSRGQMPAASGYVGRTPYWLPADIEPWLEARRAARAENG